MGWINDRHMKNGGTIGRPPKKGEWEGVPLRKIVGVIRGAENMFDQNIVELECGHTTRSNGHYRARCRKCAKENK